MKRLIINISLGIGLILMVNCGNDEGCCDPVFWNTYVIFEDDGKDLFFSNDSYDESKLKITIPELNYTFQNLSLEFENNKNRYVLNTTGKNPVFLDYGNGDIDTLTFKSTKSPDSNHYTDLETWYYLNGLEVAYMSFTNEMINELGLRNNPSNSSWTNDPILIVLPKKPEF
jgi:hypothetical protein